jgi:hypothetical protein
MWAGTTRSAVTVPGTSPLPVPDRVSPVSSAALWQRLYLSPLPHQQRSFGPRFGLVRSARLVTMKPFYDGRVQDRWSYACLCLGRGWISCASATSFKFDDTRRSPLARSKCRAFERLPPHYTSDEFCVELRNAPHFAQPWLKVVFVKTPNRVARHGLVCSPAWSVAQERRGASTAGNVARLRTKTFGVLFILRCWVRRFFAQTRAQERHAQYPWCLG